MKRSDYIYHLMMLRLAGIISEGEDRELELLIQEEDAVKMQWEQLRQQYTAEHINEKLQKYEEDWIDATAIMQLPHKKRNNIYYVLRSVAVAVIIISSITAGIYLLKQRKENSSPAVVSVGKVFPLRKNKEIVLKLGTGQAISLSTRNDTIVAAGTILSNTNKTLTYQVSEKDNKVSNDLNTLTVPIGLDYHLILSDNTQIWLNSATQLKFPLRFGRQSREISINGEAYLEVAPNAAKPFLVHTPKSTIQVLGTAFNINSYDSGIVKISLVKGAVRFKAGNKEVAIKPGQEAVYVEEKGISVHTFDEDQVLGWRHGLFPFTEATLPEIIAVLPRWFGVEVILDNSRLIHERFTGVMNRNTPLEEFLKNMQGTANIQYYFDGKGTLHFK